MRLAGVRTVADIDHSLVARPTSLATWGRWPLRKLL
jgi:hypothetical protein